LAARFHSDKIPLMTSSVIVIAPHIGFSKLMSSRFLELLSEVDVNVGTCVPNFEPFCWRHLAGWAIARSNDALLVPIEVRYGHPISDLQDRYGAIALDTTKLDVVEDLVSAMWTHRTRSTRVVFSMFPEGGSTGKRQGEGRPFRMETLRTGFLVAAKRLRLPVLPIAHVVDSFGRSYSSVLDPIHGCDMANSLVQCRVIREQLQCEIYRLLGFAASQSGK